jgi:2-polyprenyl-3-methyl-5-hydroxy-6-metoxy-1,4-benzoquinol methylase
MDELAVEYDNFYKHAPELWDSPPVDEQACRIIWSHNNQPVSILDVGCGNGHSLVRMQQEFPSASLYGIDLSGEAIRLASGKLAEAKFYQGRIEDFEPGMAFDVISVIGVAEHFIDIQSGLRSIARLMDWDGLCYILTPNNLAYSPGLHTYRRLEGGSGQMEWHLERAEWKQQLVEAGFEIITEYSGASAADEFIFMVRLA